VSDPDKHLDVGRRRLLRLTGGVGAGLLAAGSVSAALTPVPEPDPQASNPAAASGATAPGSKNTADILIETLVAWEVPFVFGIVGDGINPLIEALRKRQDKIRFIAVRHEEAAAFMASGYQLRQHQSLTGTGMLATMAPGMPYANAAKLAYPDRQSVAVVGDGGFSQLMAELATAVKYQLATKIVILKNNSLVEVRFEQEEIGNPAYGCDLSPIDFVEYAKACGAEGFRCTKPAEVRPAIAAFLRSPHTAVLEAVVDADEKPTLPHELKV
jgi:thiamine pyrophosphate-dependent acetolactate synthase large subunit-like protein